MTMDVYMYCTPSGYCQNCLKSHPHTCCQFPYNYLGEKKKSPDECPNCGQLQYTTHGDTGITEYFCGTKIREDDGMILECCDYVEGE